MAAYELKKNAPDVNFVVLERLPVIGGSLVATGGAIFGLDSKIHQENGVKPATLEEVIEFFKFTSGSEDLNEELIKNVFPSSTDTINMLADWGAPFTGETEPASPYSDELFTVRTSDRGKGFYDFLDELVKKETFDLRLETTVTDLIVEDNKVTGVVIQDKEKVYKILADQVILATGGFGSNPDMMKKYAPEYADGVLATNGGALGDGFKFVEQFGTPIVGYGTMGSIVAEDKSAVISSTFMVNAEGKRFVDETSPLYVRQRAVAEQSNNQAFVIADSNYEDKEGLKVAKDNGLVQEFTTVEELSDAIGINKDNLVKELKAYNEAVAGKKSPGFDLPADKATAVVKAPFYVEKAIIRTFGTLTSITINEKAQVLNAEGKAVEGLLACGELTAGNAFERQYPAVGVGISYATNSGRLAAKTAVSNMK